MIWATLGFAASLRVAIETPKDPYVQCVYAPRPKRLSVQVLRTWSESYREGQRLRVPVGRRYALVTAKAVAFPKYRGMETGPEGIAVSVQTPHDCRIRFSIHLPSGIPRPPLDYAIVDGRRVSASRRRPFRLSLPGGTHEVRLAWTPGE